MSTQNDIQTASAPADSLHSVVERAVALFKCDTARISSPCGHHFLILGWNKNTKTERESGRDEGQWVKTDKDGIETPFDFDYVYEQVIANGATIEEMWASAEHYKQLCDIHDANTLNAADQRPGTRAHPPTNDL